MLQLRRRAAPSQYPLGFEPEDHHLPGLRPQGAGTVTRATQILAIIRCANSDREKPMQSLPLDPDVADLAPSGPTKAGIVAFAKEVTQGEGETKRRDVIETFFPAGVSQTISRSSVPDFILSRRS